MNANDIKAFFEKGMEVCLLIREGSNPYRRIKTKEDRYIGGVVKSVGTKYITVTANTVDYKFSIEDDLQEVNDWGNIEYMLFQTRQDAEDYVRAEECYQEIRGYFDRGRNDGYFTCAEMEDILATVLSVIYNKKEK